MSARTATARYDGLTIYLHWATAALVVVQFTLAEFWDFFPKPERHLMVVGHMSFGLILTAIFALRLFWRTRPGHVRFPAEPGLMGRAAKGAHHLLYTLLALEIPLGFFTRWTDNHPLSFFGLLIPSPFGDFSKPVGEWVDQIHDITAWSIIVLAGLHALAALYHHYSLKDGVLRRMLPAA
ncbi:MAG: cytochrome b/b6 domain-containing protein [Acidocella sp.]|nr:cytochrome b/b6 domain-containing protein [Acidocella sp.]